MTSNDRDVFFDSDLSELTDEDDEEYAAPSRGSGRAPSSKQEERLTARSEPKTKAYVVRDVLRPPRSTQYTVKSLHEQLVDGSINLDPEYQRDVVWSDTKQVMLIQSIFQNYYIPPVIFGALYTSFAREIRPNYKIAVATAEDGSETRVCIDGKQRLTSIQKRTGKGYWYKKTQSSTRTLLPKAMQQQFANKQVQCVEYHDISDVQEREIFQRVQNGVALTPSERMQAIVSPRSVFIREMMDHVLEKDGFGEALDWGRSRGRDFHGLASIVFLLETFPQHKVPASGVMKTWLGKEEEIPGKLRNSIAHTLQIFRHLTRSSHFSEPFHTPTRVSPMEFIMIGVLIHKHRQTLSLMQLSSAIARMRADIRKKEKDIRTNPRCSKLLYDFIMVTLPKQSGSDETYD
ncbi:hypothetical protein K488DRAFT_77027 [Vararia minispora EC-137]|uniref:Uncharacterized protein n=1 Tax=Vararia minispora EC-137 TaxID=1314806 RepID=A0ACB8QT21_9AGAM|nr:hypothetical protein K488DRAFT_77027 [Vararia minispora EC-137]